MLVSLSGHEILSLASGSVYEDLGQKWDLSLSVIWIQIPFLEIALAYLYTCLHFKCDYLI